RHLAELLGELAQVLRRLLEARALRLLLAGPGLQAARELLEARALRVRVRVEALLDARLGGGEVRKRLLAVPAVLAQLALEVGELLLEQLTLLGRERLVLGDLLADLLDLGRLLLEALAHQLPLPQH